MRTNLIITVTWSNTQQVEDKTQSNINLQSNKQANDLRATTTFCTTTTSDEQQPVRTNDILPLTLLRCYIATLLRCYFVCYFAT